MSAIPLYYTNELVGTLQLSVDNTYCLDYAPSWQANGFAISVNLPLNVGHHEGRVVEYYVENLLPEGELRKALAARYGVSEGNYYALMQAVGKDCAGAFSVGAPQSSGEYAPLAEEDLENELLHLRATHLPTVHAGKSYSLAGAQDKEVIFEEKGQFYLPLHGAASNAIIKTPGRHEGSVENELFCMKLARAVGLEVADVSYLPLPRIPSLLVKRYDRRGKGRAITRVLQEDFCQLSALPSSLKYEKEGGPGFADCAALIRRYSSIPAADLARLVDWAGFNIAIGNMDAHAKNIALYQIDGQKRLAPFYDLISTRYYPAYLVNGDLAMSIGGRINPDKIGAKQWERFAQDIHLPAPVVLRRLRKLWTDIIAHLPDTATAVQQQIGHPGIIPELKAQILDRTLRLAREL